MTARKSSDFNQFLEDDRPRQIGNTTIRLGEQIAVVGATESGKTFFTMNGLLQYYKRSFPNVPRYVLDSTADPDMQKYEPDAIRVEGNQKPDMLFRPSTVIWTPRNSKLPVTYNDWFNDLIDARRPVIVILDEIASITRQALEGLEVLFKQLRKHGGTVVGETQRIARVNSDVFSQITHFFMFHINPEPYDLLQARTYLSIPKESFHMPRAKYGFYHRKTRGSTPAREYTDVYEFFNTL